MTETRSVWQQRIEGVWYGMPSVFDAEGHHVGYGRFERTVTTDGEGRPVFMVRPELQLEGPLRERLRSVELVLWVLDDGSRVYVGRDFYGAGMPFGSALLGSDYLQPWDSVTSVVVQLLPGGKTQVYSLLLYEGPTLLGVLLGNYTLLYDYARSDETRAAVEAFLAAERSMGQYPFSAASARAGRWVGQIEAFGADSEPLGLCEMTIAQRPCGEDGADLTVMVGGALSWAWRTTCRRQGQHYFFEGPDLYGNGAAFGRALFTTRYVQGQALKIVGREMLLDERHTLAIVWQLLRDGRPEAVLAGVLDLEAL
ncbi:MAG: hypothetical protein HGA45_05505 [Chloroflexales bacterium]|nr:hypothetical protein [Chloroflexales bacterium]